VDFNGDGIKDLLAGDAEGNVWFFKNTGSATQPKLAAGVKIQAAGKTITGTRRNYEKDANGRYHAVDNPNAIMGVYSKIHVADWNGDGLPDLLVGQDSPRANGGQLLLYRNVGTVKEPKLAAPEPLDIMKGNVSRPSPYVVDWDGDGKRDVLLGTENDQVLFLRNIGTNQRPEFDAPQPIELRGLNKCYRCRIAVVDWNNDGKLDLLVGTRYSAGESGGGNVWLFLRK